MVNSIVAARVFAATSALALLASCGGGGGSNSGGSGGTTPPVSTAPRFTSSTTASVIENTADSFYTATATDPQNDAIAFSIIGGADAGDFVLAADGTLSFDVPANFDQPRDDNGDNMYEVVLRATAGGETTDLSLRVSVTNDKEGISVTRIASGFTNPVGLSMIFDGQRLLVAEKSGRVAEVDGDTGAITERDDVEANLRAGDIVSVAYAGRGLIFIEGAYFLIHSQTDGLYLQVVSLSNGNFDIERLGEPSNERVSGKLFRGEGNHLIAAIGDPGGAWAQNDNSAYGKLWSTANYDPYAGASLPPNPFVFVSKIGDGIGDPGGGFARANRTYLADRGATIEDEMTIFSADWRPLDFGWPFYEGYTQVSVAPPSHVNGPTLTYQRGPGPRAGDGIVGGVIYGGEIESIADHYVFGDASGVIWSVPRTVLEDGFRHNSSDFEVRSDDFAPDQGTIDSPVAFELGLDDRLYILDSDGEIFRVDRAQ